MNHILLLRLNMPDNSVNISKDSENYWEQQSIRLHEIMLKLGAIYSIVIGIVNILSNQWLQAAVILSLLPIVVIAWWMYKEGFLFYSKLWNVISLLILITIESLMAGPDTFNFLYFFPVILGSLIEFQREEKRVGFIITGIAFILILFCCITPYRIGDLQENVKNSVETERIINLIGTFFCVFLQISYIIGVTNKIQASLIQKQEDLKESNIKLQETIYTRDRMTSIISHDLRSPMASIKAGISLMLQMQNAGKDTTEVLTRLKKRTEETDYLLNNILLWAKFQTSDVKPLKDDIIYLQVHDFVQNYFLLITEDKKLTLELDWQGAPEASIYCDLNQVQTILRNLISNAVKFTPAGKKITIASQLTSYNWHFKISDEGEGIPTEKISRLLNTETSARNISTSGLGLQLVHEFLSHHNSKLEIESEVGKGSSFGFMMPTHSR